MLPIREVTYAKCYLYEMLPRQSVLYEMLLYENVLYETLLIPTPPSTTLQTAPTYSNPSYNTICINPP